MFDIGWFEILIIMVVALLVIGPKELPSAMRSIAMLWRRFRWTLDDLRSQVNQFMYTADIEEVERQAERIQNQSEQIEKQTPKNPE